MLKRLVFAFCSLAVVVGLALPPTAVAQVRIGVQLGAPAVAYQSGYHEGYYYQDGYRYQRDSRGYRHYDHAYTVNNNWKADRAHRDGNHHDENHPDGDHRDWRKK